jgi:hypothetical protein
MRISGVVIVGVFAVGGCSSTTSSSSGATADGGASNGSVESALTCIGILECASTCGDDNTPCEDACIGKGTPDAKTDIDAIVACIDKFTCEDEVCFRENCSSELATCVKPAAGKPLTGDAPAGNVPGDLVGKWYSHGELWEFRADGSVTHGGTVDTSGCSTGNLESGTAVANEGTLTIYFTEGGVSICGGDSSETYAPNTKNLTYRLSTYSIDGVDRAKLSLTDVDCVEKHNGDDFYCINGFDKQ